MCIEINEVTYSNLARVAVANKIDKIVHVSCKDMHSTVAQRDVIACAGRDKIARASARQVQIGGGRRVERSETLLSFVCARWRVRSRERVQSTRMHAYTHTTPSHVHTSIHTDSRRKCISLVLINAFVLSFSGRLDHTCLDGAGGSRAREGRQSRPVAHRTPVRTRSMPTWKASALYPWDSADVLPSSTSCLQKVWREPTSGEHRV